MSSSRRTTSAWTGLDSWMAERAPPFIEKAVAIIELERSPPTDDSTFCVDEQTGIGVRAPAALSPPVAPKRPVDRECAYIRHGTADLLAAFGVNTGAVTGIVRPRRLSAEFLELLEPLDQLVPQGQVIHLIRDPVRRHASAEVARYPYDRPEHFAFHWVPKHISWLPFREAWFAILSKKCLKRVELTGCADAERAITGFIATANAQQAKPFTWKQGIKFYQRLKDKLAKRHAAPVSLESPAATDLPAAA
jgi:hypothetical protein